MKDRPPLSEIEVIAPNFSRRVSGVTATVVHLLPLQREHIGIAAAGCGLPADIPRLGILDILLMPPQCRVWHARRNVEMVAGVLLRDVLRKQLKLVFTSAAQRHHTHFTKALIRRMDAVVATSKKSADYLQREAVVIPHGVDCQRFAPVADKAAVRKAQNLPDGVLIGCYGRIRPQKGTDVFVAAMIKVLPHHPHATAVIMGETDDAPFARRLMEKIASAQLAERIMFHPPVPWRALPQMYQALDLFIAPPRWEGFGLTPLEAMACGVPVVATRVGAFEDIVAAGETGFLTPPDSVDAVATAADKLLSQPELLKTTGIKARRRIEECFRLTNEASALVDVYRQLLNTPRGAA